MRQNLNLKISGDKDAIQKLVELLEASYQVFAKSRFIPNDTGGYHLFIDLEDK